MTILRILFVGMMAFAPDDPGQPGKVTVLLRDARMASELGGECIQPHLPLLHWDARCSGDCKTGGSHTFWTCDQLAVTVAEDDAVWVLAEEELQISFQRESESELRWEADMITTMPEIHKGQLGHGPAKTLHEYWKEPKIDPGRGVVARVQLDRGVFEDCHLVDWAGETANLWYARLEKLKQNQKDSQHSGAATDVVLATMTASAKSAKVEVVGTPFGDTPARKIILKPRPCNDGTGNDCITLVVENQSTLVDKPSRFGRHFERLYGFSQKAKAKNRWVPFVPELELEAPLVVADASCTEATGRFRDVLDLLLSGKEPDREDLVLPDHAVKLWNLGNRPVCPLTQY